MSETIELTIERPVAGGRMLARRNGRVIFVAGAIPGERVRARVVGTTKHAVFATVTDVLDASPDRRAPAHDPHCGGAVFAHIAYGRQLALKQEILIDAFRRLARLAIDPPSVAASPEQGYRLRSRLHVAGGRAGYFLEGTHTICDAAATRQLLPDGVPVAQALVSAVDPAGEACEAIVVSENIAASERVLHLEWRDGADVRAATANAGTAAASLEGVTGVTTLTGGSLRTLAGRPDVTDDGTSLFGAEPPFGAPIVWSRRPASFFQGNRFLVGSLVRRVLDAAAGDRVVDLYAGVGLFSVALAARGASVAAVEGERFAVEDLRRNASPWPDRLEVVAAPVEEVVKRPPAFVPDVVVADPPRTGLSAAALTGVAAWRAPRLVYVSCDPPTLARDTAKLIAAGYQLASLEAFDLFPNTAHVEAMGVFTR
ncbi:MAG TPA: TRAM domain-containing protein [Vicinamibacterales bacterium]|nr:TRAM domain-containing protein [Vicinamibacterales bacterium]